MDTLVEPEPPVHIPADPSPNEPVDAHVEPPADTQDEPKDTKAEANDTNDAPICRICLMGSEEADELGKLIRPCLCKGTVGHVHVNCLNTWRKASAARKAFWQCDQCGYKYRFVRMRALGLAQSKFVVGCSTLTLFTILVFTASFLFSLFLPTAWIEGSSSAVAQLVDDSVEKTVGGSSWYYYESPTSLTNSMWKIAYQTLNDLFDTVLSPSDTDAPVSSSYRYKAKPRGMRRPRPQTRVSTAHDPSTGRSGPSKGTVSASRAVVAEMPVRLSAPVLDEEDDDYDATSRRPGFFMRLLRRFLLGLSVVGAFSLLSLGWTFHVPLQWARRRFRRGEERDTSLYTLIVLGFILIGVAKAMYSTYKLTQIITTALLIRAETAILEVGSDEAVPLDPPRMNARATFAQMRTLVFWQEVWWACVRWLRGLKDTVIGAWNVLRQDLRWRDIITALGAIFFAFMGVGAGWGGVWVWQF